MSVQRNRHMGLAMAAGATLLFAASQARAALPPYWQSAREIEAILDDQQVHDAFKYEEPILSISTTGNDAYEIRTPRCVLTVTIVDAPTDTKMVGPRQFNLDIGEADCQ